MAKEGPRWVETRMHTVRGHLGKDEVDEQAGDDFSSDWTRKKRRCSPFGHGDS